ncbi:hypothetical protein F5882DRAFT_441951, partial [Hyaloscypha sp. PMI_1271]
MATAFKDSSALGDGLGESPRIAEGGGGHIAPETKNLVQGLSDCLIDSSRGGSSGVKSCASAFTSLNSLRVLQQHHIFSRYFTSRDIIDLTTNSNDVIRRSTVMAPSSGDCRMPALKTYSKRVKYHTEEPPSKKRRVEEPLPVTLSPRVKKPEGSTIQSYFRPLQRSSSPSTTRVPHRASTALEHISSPKYQLPSDSLEHTSPPRTRSSQLSSDPLEPTSTPP